jgi:hypothetical protein
VQGAGLAAVEETASVEQREIIAGHGFVEPA